MGASETNQLAFKLTIIVSGQYLDKCTDMNAIFSALIINYSRRFWMESTVSVAPNERNQNDEWVILKLSIRSKIDDNIIGTIC